MMHHRKLVVFVVRRQVLGQLSFQDALQAGRLGLWHAIRGFDPQKGYAFSTYAYPAIARSIWRAVRQAERDATSQPARWSLLLDALAGDPEQVVEAHLVQVTLDDLIRRLPDQLRQVIIARYGLAGKSPTSLREIGSTLGLSGERVRLLQLEALVWLRHPAHSQVLRSLLGRHTVADYEWAEQLAQCWLRRRRGGRYGAD